MFRTSLCSGRHAGLLFLPHRSKSFRCRLPSIFQKGRFQKAVPLTKVVNLQQEAGPVDTTSVPVRSSPLTGLLLIRPRMDTTVASCLFCAAL
jgi:hypothetical protein